jgi:hypothetical protein
MHSEPASQSIAVVAAIYHGVVLSNNETVVAPGNLTTTAPAESQLADTDSTATRIPM